MNVVIRGLMAAAMAVYASIHALQAFNAPDSAPLWLVLAFGATALIGLGIAVGLILTAEAGETRWEGAAALLAGISAVALSLSYSTGFLGIVETDLRAETAIVAVAEAIAVGSWVLSLVSNDAAREVSEPSPLTA